MRIFSLILVVASLFLASAISVLAAEQAKPSSRTQQADHQVVTEHETEINGADVEYTATTGTQPLWNEQDEEIAAIHYTYYKRSDVDDSQVRPLLISFNGGPGSASVWMHLAYTGPKVIHIDDEGYPLQPYGVKANPYSVLDVADIVFVNPVNTGYSRILKNKEGKLPGKDKQKEMFFGVNADVKYLADWLNTFVTRHGRWRSPKFLIGESYGTTRVSALSLELQNQQWMYLNGVVLVSPTDIGIKREGPVKAANRLPYFAATAWYHKALPDELQAMDLLEILALAEEYAINDYLPALARGAFLDQDKRSEVAEKVAYFSGLSKKQVLQNNLDIDNAYFWKMLLNDRGQTVGRLDSRYLGIDRKETGSRPDYWPELTSWLHSFTPAINHYFTEELKYKTDVKYNMFGPVHPWDRSDNNAGENLRLAMAQNPYLKVMVQSGYYDGATNYFDGKYNLWQLDPSGKMRDRLSFKGYRSGHMMYLRYEDLKQSNEDLREFILEAVPAADKAAKY